ncbi:MAG: protein-L-isoaspartate O-methyltransferase family protein [Sphingorhabdus sp.]|uniref:protein-L-isoaspartate O-methyltransferase family protein n=1 Tax=Sphingorhabdus sp. TaxID=1902408 RepID=UPI0038FCC139
MESVSFEEMRRAMVESQLRTNGVTQAWVLAAMGAVAREDHVPASHRNICYNDRAIATGDGAVLNPPLATALLLQSADIAPDARVLLISAQDGYVAAVVRQHVAAVTLVDPDAVHSAADAAPFDVIIIDGAVEILPDAVLALAAEGATLVTGVAEGPVTRLAKGFVHDGRTSLKPFIDSEIAPLAAFARKPEFTF